MSVKYNDRFTHEALLKLLQDAFNVLVVPVGSRVVCDPAPADTDDDRLVFVNKVWHPEVRRLCTSAGFRAGGSEGLHKLGKSRFISLKHREGRGGVEMNIILTHDVEFFERFKVATVIAQRLNLQSKRDRVALYDAILYSVAPETSGLDEIMNEDGTEKDIDPADPFGDFNEEIENGAPF